MHIKTGFKNQNDTELVVDHLFDTFFKVGDACPLVRQPDSSASDIRVRVDALIERLVQSSEAFCLPRPRQAYHIVPSPRRYWPDAVFDRSGGMNGYL